MSDVVQNNDGQLKFDAIRIGLASPDKIRDWSRGEVTKPETINYRTLKPEKDGLFCERIFGPQKDWECHCGKYKKIRYRGVVCDRCGVEITKSSVRRERMGHIELAAPVSHIWYFKGNPSKIAVMLDISAKNLEKVIYFGEYIVIDPGTTDLTKCEVISHEMYNMKKAEFGKDSFEAEMGAEAIKKLLAQVNVEEEYEKLREEYTTTSAQNQAKIAKRLEVMEAFKNSNNRPEWMILDVIPVIPPDLRPMVQLDGGRFATSDLNDLYRRIINRNNRLKKLLLTDAPDMIVRNEKRMLQEAVDALIDNGRRGRAVTGPGNRALKSLSEMLKGKQGRFRQNLLGKRVDYSGRSVIVVGPELKIYQCGLPKEMAIELFKPFVMKELVARKEDVQNIKYAKKKVERLEDDVWDVLEDVIKEHPVMLNRAPTLHRLGIQAFEPILVEGKAIKLHPLVCTAYNADFDGDQMAVHLPLSVEAQAECRFLMLSPNNLLKPSDGGPVAVPSQDMVLGVYYLTMNPQNDDDTPGAIKKAWAAYESAKAEADKAAKSKDKEVKATAADLKAAAEEKLAYAERLDRTSEELLKNANIYKSENEALLAYDNKAVGLHDIIRVRRTGVDKDGNKISKVVTATVGRIIFNEVIPQDLGYVDRDDAENALEYEINFRVGKKQLKQLLDKCINLHGATDTAEVLDSIKSLGYSYSTRAAMTVSVSDMTIPESKPAILEAAQKKVDFINKSYRRGMVTEDERYKGVIDVWFKADDELAKDLINGLDNLNNIYMMADSGARGSNQQIKQLAGMRGLMADTQQRTIELPIKSNFREGLDVLEYFISAHGARKGLSDTALRTADSGYLTRRLVDVAQDIVIREVDCAEGQEELPGMYVIPFKQGKNDSEVIESFYDRILGRYAAESIFDADGNMIVKRNHMITPVRAQKIIDAGYGEKDPETGEYKGIRIRTALSCCSKKGVCSKCYGANLATTQMVQVGEAVGIIAAQSIGEPGTQLTMRNFHAGGVAGGDDITQGLPRVEQLFEARIPKNNAILAEFGGTCHVPDNANNKDSNVKREIVITNDETGESKSYAIPAKQVIKVRDGQVVEAGSELTNGQCNPQDILRIRGVRAVQDYMIREVQSVYRLQGVDINDKHVEIIVRQMLKKVKITDVGDSNYLPESQVSILDFDETNRKLIAEGKKPAEGTRILLGITRAALATDSFLSAASFQMTTQVLTDAAVYGKTDPLVGLKENVLIGKLIPAGTGMKRYRSVKLDSEELAEEEVVLDVEATEVEAEGATE
ncbi:MAG: DNA-directed RNA polymerase subunit beta' [Lachnospiraceae bacterium]|nr:DNA-directed RNA polymerase subunit beta' [Lachnospiraceae bacterium]